MSDMEIKEIGINPLNLLESEINWYFLSIQNMKLKWNKMTRFIESFYSDQNI